MKGPVARAALIFGLLGALVPVILLATAIAKDETWWPKWTLYVWPTSYMLGANAGSADFAAYLIVAVSIAINAILYGYLGSVVFRVLRASGLLKT